MNRRSPYKTIDLLSLQKIIGLFIFSCLLFFPEGLFPQDKKLAIRGGKLITVTRGDIENGVLLIRNGKIEAIGKDIHIPSDAKVIDASKCTVLPGLIDSFTNLGTTEVELIDKDFDEATSPVTPHLRIIDALNSDNSYIPLARKRGVTAALSAPGEGNLLSGQSALIHLAGQSVEDMVIKFPVAVHGNLGEAPKLRYGKKEKMPSTRMGEAALLRQTLIDAQDHLHKILTYEKKKKEFVKKEKGEEPLPPSTDFKLQSLIPVIKGEMFLIFRANRHDDILTALRIAEEFHLKIIINHGAEAYRVADKLASRNIPVLVGPVASYFQRIETRRAAYESVLHLHKAGVKFAFQTGSVQNISDLLYQAELAVTYGLPYEEAIKALTLYPAQIFGVDDELGSLEKGKTADVVIFEGDPLKRLSKVRMVIIKGEILEDLF